MRIFIGNLSKMTTARQLADLFHPFGEVLTSKIVKNESTGHSMGFGFIEMASQFGIPAIRKLNSRLFMNSYMEVTEAL